MSAIDDIIKNLYLTRNIAAYHLDREKTKEKDYNESNPGWGLEYQDGDKRYMIGQYLNSLRNNSNYALMGYTPYHYDTGMGMLSGGVVGGAVTGYPYMPVTPAAGLLGTYENGKFGANLMLTPTVTVDGKSNDGFLGLQGKYKF